MQIFLLLFLSHLVKLRFDFVDLCLDLVAQLCLTFDVIAGILEVSPIFSDVLLMSWAWLGLKVFKFYEGCLFVDCRPAVLILLAALWETSKIFSFLLLMDKLIFLYWEFLVVLHLCDSFLTFLADFDFCNRFWLQRCKTKSEFSHVKDFSNSILQNFFYLIFAIRCWLMRHLGISCLCC